MVGWKGRWEGWSGWGIHVTTWLIHVNVWQNPLKCCEVISPQLIKINEKNLKKNLHSNVEHWYPIPTLHRKKLRLSFRDSCEVKQIQPQFPSSFVSSPGLFWKCCPQNNNSISIAWELVEMQVLRPYPSPAESETLESRPSHLWFKTPSRWLWCTLKLENHCSSQCPGSSPITRAELFRLHCAHKLHAVWFTGWSVDHTLSTKVLCYTALLCAFSEQDYWLGAVFAPLNSRFLKAERL